ncbi:GDP-L-galactose phosphorylase 1 [Diplonema papillatum]|nr:GDP-L-galactose phosphorylase 1 [Diplonema papillatum]
MKTKRSVQFTPITPAPDGSPWSWSGSPTRGARLVPKRYRRHFFATAIAAFYLIILILRAELPAGSVPFIDTPNPLWAFKNPNPLLHGKHPYHFPLYYEEDDTVFDELTVFEQKVLTRWRTKHDRGGVFHYQMGSDREPMLNRPLNDEFGMVLQAAVGRAGKRSMNRTTTSVYEPVDPAAFNFGKAKAKELLYLFTDEGRRQVFDTPVDSGQPLQTQLPPLSNALIVNANPFALFHFLLVPSVSSILPQVLTKESLRLAVRYSTMCSGHLKLIFNSIGAGSSINHQHWQGFYMKQPLPIEKAATRSVSATAALQIREVTNWPIRSFVFTSPEEAVLVASVFLLVEKLLAANVAHNLLIYESGRKVAVVPRKIGYFPDVSKKQIAAMEVLGFWVIPNMKEYEELTAAEGIEFLRTARPEPDVDVAGLFATRKA